jgi:hypothetical protein
VCGIDDGLRQLFLAIGAEAAYQNWMEGAGKGPYNWFFPDDIYYTRSIYWGALVEDMRILRMLDKIAEEKSW